MLNKIILIGRLTRDPELKYSGQGTAVANFTLAVNRKFKKEETDFINCVIWRQSAEFAANYGSKGRLTMVEGRLQVRNYENNEGKKVYVTEVVVDDIKFLDRKSEDKPPTNSAQTGFEDLGKEIRLEDIDLPDTEEIPF